MAAAADDLFSDALRYLQNTHETQVALLLKENSALRTELQELHSGAEWYQRVQERKDSRASLGSAEEAESRAEKVERHAEALSVVESGSRHREHLKRRADRGARSHRGPKGSPVPGASPQASPQMSPQASPQASPRVAEVRPQLSGPGDLGHVIGTGVHGVTAGAAAVLHKAEEKIGGKAPHPKESEEEKEEHEREALEAELHQLEEDDPELAEMLHFDKNALAKPHSFRGRVQKLVLWHGFDLAIGVVICMNAGTIGYAAAVKKQGDGTVPKEVDTMETLFLVVYIFEIAMRYLAFGIRALKTHWVKFDLFLVICGSVDFLLQSVTLSASVRAGLEKMMLLRILRLARIVRVLRLLSQFKTLWLLVNGLMHSLMTLVWVMVLISILLYVFAILGLEVLTVDESVGYTHDWEWEMQADYNRAIEKNFANMGYTMLTLLQGLTLDSVGSVYRPIVLWRPTTLAYFIAFILLVSIALMNLVTAIMVESSLAQASEDKEQKKKDMEAKTQLMIKRLEVMFVELDVDKSGTLQLEEITRATPEMQSALWDVVQSHDSTDLVNIFKLLDYDDSGHLEIEEFCDGLVARHQGKSLEILCLLQLCRDILWNTREGLKLAAGQSESLKCLEAAYGLKSSSTECTCYV